MTAALDDDDDDDDDEDGCGPLGAVVGPSYSGWATSDAETETQLAGISRPAHPTVRGAAGDLARCEVADHLYMRFIILSMTTT